MFTFGVRPAALFPGLILVSLLLVSAPAASEPGDASEAFSFGGPIELQDVFFPAQLRPQSYAESAVLVPEGAFGLGVVVDWTNNLAKTDTYLFDGESVTTTARLRYAPWRRVELGLDVPFTSRFDGTLDPFIERVETALDAQVQARFELPRSNWAALVTRNDGSRTLRMFERTRLQDISVRAKIALVDPAEHSFDAALVASLGLPTGATTFGGDGVTPALGLHAQRPFDTVNLFGGATIQYHSAATEQEFLLAPWRWMTYAGTEWRPWRSWLGLLVEYQVYSDIARSNTPLNHMAHYYAGGLRFYLPHRVTLEAAVVENLGLIENRNSSDVTFHFGAAWRFGL